MQFYTPLDLKHSNLYFWFLSLECKFVLISLFIYLYISGCVTHPLCLHIKVQKILVCYFFTFSSLSLSLFFFWLSSLSLFDLSFLCLPIIILTSYAYSGVFSGMILIYAKGQRLNFASYWQKGQNLKSKVHRMSFVKLITISLIYYMKILLRNQNLTLN